MKLIRIFFFSALFIFTTFAQIEIPVNEFGLKIVTTTALYDSLVKIDSSQKLVDLELIIPNLKKNIIYATKENITKQVLYLSPKVFLRNSAALALQKVSEELSKHGIGIIIYDAYRPYSVTLKLWEAVKDENFAASPKTGSRHNRGCAIDLSLYDLKTGKLLEMPTVFDDFTEKASHKYLDIPTEARINRALLRLVMEKYGFISLESEWWHYDFEGWKNYSLTDIPFEFLKP
jgi:D-alanyl-D-alanine dipeptidase